MTVGNREFYIYRYEGKLNDIENAVVILSYPKEAFLNPKALRVFISTDISLSTQEILDTYVCRWPIEVFFRESKRKLALDKYQVRTRRGTERYWLIMSLVHLMCCSYKADDNSFESGYQYLQQAIQKEKVTKLYMFIREGMLLEDVLQLVG